MYKVLIVDDEIIVRMGLKMAVDWEQNGFEVIGEASNGQHAMEIIRENVPDIVITDVKMPVMNGIQLIKELKKCYPTVKVLVLSNYGDFDYVKEALKNGADDYFLKVTIEPDKLIEILKGISNKIEKERVDQEVDTELRNKLYESKMVIKKRMFSELMKHASNKKNFKEKVECISTKIILGQGFLLLVTLPEYNEIVSSRFEGDSELLMITMHNFITGIVHDRFQGEVVEHGVNQFIILIGCESSFMPGIDKHLAERLKDAIKEYLSINITIFYNMWFRNLEELRYLLLNLNDIMLMGFYVEKSTLIDSSTMILQWINVDDSLENLKKNLSIYIKLKDFDKFKTLFEDYILEAKETNLNPILLKRGLLTLFNCASYCFYEFYGKPINMECTSILSQIKDSISFVELRNHFDTILCKFKTMLDDVTDISYRKEILEVMEYVEKNIHQEITLEMISDMVYMNKNYFCRLFKKETGENFQSYLTKIRMQKAKELLLNCDCNVDEIALRVGYKNISYFSKVFKGFYKIPPSEYRKIKVEAPKEPSTP